MSKGYIYVLSNPEMPGILKIGRSVNGGRNRASEIYTTGVPSPFKVEFEMLVDDCIEAEAQMHENLSHARINPNREFFRVEVEEAVRVALDLASADIGCVILDEEYFFAFEAVHKFATALKEQPFIISAALIYLDREAIEKAVSKWAAKHSNHPKLKVVK